MDPTAERIDTSASRALAAEIARLETLHAVIRWARSHPELVSNRSVFSDVIVQDEYCHDAVLPLQSGWTVVIGST